MTRPIRYFLTKEIVNHIMSAGKRVGRYELGKTLGEGTFGKVKSAKNVDSGEKFAIKVGLSQFLTSYMSNPKIVV